MMQQTINQKITTAKEQPFIRSFDNVDYILYDEVKNLGHAQRVSESLERRGYKTHIEHRQIDDIMKGKFYTVYDIFFVKN
jgi:hypothetical protein